MRTLCVQRRLRTLCRGRASIRVLGDARVVPRTLALSFSQAEPYVFPFAKFGGCERSAESVALRLKVSFRENIMLERWTYASASRELSRMA